MRLLPRSILVHASLGGLVLTAVALPSQAAGHQLQTVALPGAFSTTLNDINNSGVAVGAATIDANVGISTGVVFDHGALSSFAGPPGAISADLAGITNAGVLFGNSASTLVDDGSGNLFVGPTTIFSYGAGAFQTYTIPGAPDAYASGVSPNGRWIVGFASDAQQNTQGFAFDTWSNTSVFLHHSGALTVIAAGVNDAGQVVGYDRTFVPGTGNIGGAWVYDIGSGTFADVAIPDAAPRNAARDIDASGHISGYFGDARFRSVHAFAGLGGTYEVIDAQGALVTAVVGANDLGTVVGYYQTALDGTSSGFIARPVPEPAAALLMLLGLAGLGASRRAMAARQQHGSPR